MDYVRAKLPQSYWGPINQCRLFLTAVTLSDIVTFDGTEIPQEIYDGKGSYRKSTIVFPKQKRPPKASWECWKYYVRWITGDDTKKLLVPLGK